MTFQRSGSLFYHVFVIVFGVMMIYPIIWLFMSSLKPESAIFTHPFDLWPESFHWEHYVKGWQGTKQLHFYHFFENSAFVSVVVMIGSVFSSSLVAYGFARIPFKFRSFLFACLMMTMLLPNQVLLIPQYIIFKNIGWVDTYLPITVPQYFGGTPFFIFLMVQFIRSISYELDEAAIIDGCGQFGIYRRIILPLCVPALATVAIFSFMWSWDDFLSPLIYLNNPNLFTVPIGLSMFNDPNTGTSWGQMFSMGTLSLLPILILFFFTQRYLTEGISTTGLKG